MKRAPNRVVAGVPAPNVMNDGSMTSWAPDFLKRRTDVSKETVDKFLTKTILAPQAEVSMYPWKEPKKRIPLEVGQGH